MHSAPHFTSQIYHHKQSVTVTGRRGSFESPMSQHPSSGKRWCDRVPANIPHTWRDQPVAYADVSNLGAFCAQHGMVVSRGTRDGMVAGRAVAAETMANLSALPVTPPPAFVRSLTQELSALSVDPRAGTKSVDSNLELQAAIKNWTEVQKKEIGVDVHGVKDGALWGTIDLFHTTAFFEVPLAGFRMLFDVEDDEVEQYFNDLRAKQESIELGAELSDGDPAAKRARTSLQQGVMPGSSSDGASASSGAQPLEDPETAAARQRFRSSKSRPICVDESPPRVEVVVVDTQEPLEPTQLDPTQLDPTQLDQMDSLIFGPTLGSLT